MPRQEGDQDLMINLSWLPLNNLALSYVKKYKEVGDRIKRQDFFKDKFLSQTR